jgi:D-alanyl-D-alanine dipeptidase
MKLPKEVISNRELLKGVMKRHGFVVDPMEWWHFNYQSNKLFDLLDIPFEQLE